LHKQFNKNRLISTTHKAKGIKNHHHHHHHHHHYNKLITTAAAKNFTKKEKNNLQYSFSVQQQQQEQKQPDQTQKPLTVTVLKNPSFKIPEKEKKKSLPSLSSLSQCKHKHTEEGTVAPKRSIRNNYLILNNVCLKLINTIK
jgi:hypothetical protein